MMVADLPVRTEMDVLEDYLFRWANWQRHSRGDLPEACPTVASGGLQSYTGFDFDEMCEHMDEENAETTNIGILRLPDTERNAIYFERGIVTDFEPARYEYTLANAKARLMVELKKLGLWFGS